MRLKTTLHGNVYSFSGLKELFGKANEEKSGDMLQGIGAGTASERIAAKIVLSELTLEQIRQDSLILPEKDEVSRVIEEGVNETVYKNTKSMTAGDLRYYLFSHKTSCTDIDIMRQGLTSEMIATTAKLMSSMGLVYGAKEKRAQAKRRYEIGKEGMLSFRLQPNHPQYDPKGITASVYEGPSFSSGDGERPGLVTNERLSCYVIYEGDIRIQENVGTVMSNIFWRHSASKGGRSYRRRRPCDDNEQNHWPAIEHEVVGDNEALF